jgi:PadR family transcriptional regulator, regulatory protein PadR
MARRPVGSLLAIEYDILEFGVVMQAATGSFYGFALARHLSSSDGSRAMIGHGTLYKALGRMTVAGLLVADWEDPNVAAGEGRPRRKFYRVTGDGASALASRPAPSQTAVSVSRMGTA